MSFRLLSVTGVGVAPGYARRARRNLAKAAPPICVVVLLLCGASVARAGTQGEAIVKAAAAQKGVPYCWGGGGIGGPSHGYGDEDKEGDIHDCGAVAIDGFDCSGLTQYAVYKATGRQLPRKSEEQGGEYAKYGGVLVSRSELQPGDLVFFGGRSLASAEHVGIYAGGGMMWDSNVAIPGMDPREGVYERSMSTSEGPGFPYDGAVRYWHEGSTGPPPEGSYVHVSGNNTVYRIVGGAPIAVSSWSHVGGPQPVLTISQAEFNSLAEQPRDGTLISGYGNATVYITTGGAPIAVHAWSAIGGQQGRAVYEVDPSAIAHAGDGGAWNHLNRVPADGTFVKGYGHAAIYRVAGGAPLAIGNESVFEAIHPSGVPVTMVDQEAIERAGGAGAWSHLNRVPADGTFVKGYGHATIYRTAGGAPIAIGGPSVFEAIHPSGVPVTMVDQEAIEKAGGAGAWSHLRAYPASGTILRAGPEGPLYEVREGAPYSISSLPSGATAVMVDPAAIANAGRPGAWRFLRAPAVVESASPSSTPSGEGSSHDSPGQAPAAGSASSGVKASKTAHPRKRLFSVEKLGPRSRARLARTGKLVVRVRVRGPGRLWLAVLARRNPHHSAIVVGRESRSAKKHGVVSLAVHVSSWARDALSRHHRMGLRVRVRFSGDRHVEVVALPSSAVRSEQTSS
jgi:cell wall-associated NlpC family hydrolase